MFKTRLLSGILLVVIALITVITGGNVLFATLFLISMIGVYELYRVFEIENKAVGICGFLFAAGYYGLLYAKPLLPDTTDWFMLLFMAFVICLMAVLVFSYPKYRTEQMLAAFSEYLCGSDVVLYLSDKNSAGRCLSGMAGNLSVPRGCDTCAYCVGMLIGKHKMAPKLSPKKSVEGGIGGIAGAALIAVLYALAINHWGNAGVSVASFAIIGAAGGAISQIGDLAASAIKRNHDIKDYGKLIPGHGGILDRFDSIIFTAPINFYLSVLL